MDGVTCCHAVPMPRGGMVFCRLPIVKTPLVSERFCAACPFANQPCENPRPVPDPAKPDPKGKRMHNGPLATYPEPPEHMACSHRGAVIRVEKCKLCGENGKPVNIYKCGLYSECALGVWVIPHKQRRCDVCEVGRAEQAARQSPPK